MVTETKIEWCDATFSPWIDNGAKRVKTSEAYWRQPHKWNLEAEAEGGRRRVFCASLADVFEDWEGIVHDHRGRELVYLTHRTSRRNAKWVTLDDLRRDLFVL